ncbi:MAG TPA: hypothetical protein ENH99_01575 [Candidatus Pacearchaeota archaeon]|nr:hypothetical protein [Candidatus Pacearchaeota archaeon]
MNSIMLLLARIFGTHTVGVDFAKSEDKTVRVDGYIFRGKTYIAKIKEVTREDEMNENTKVHKM